MPTYPTITIENFRAIKGTLSLDLNSKYLILIGQQATGKSTIAKCVFLCQSLLDLLRNHIFSSAAREKISPDRVISSFKIFYAERFSDTFDGSMKADSRINYEFADGYSISFKYHPSNIVSVSFSERLQDFIGDVVNEFNGFDYHNESSSTNYVFLNVFRSVVRKIAPFLLKNDFVPVYIPASRANYSIVHNALGFLDMIHFDFPEKSFLSSLGFAKRQFEMNRRINGKSNKVLMRDKAVACLNGILKGEYVQENDGEYIVSPDGSRTPFFIASSGQQEILSLGLILIRQLSASVSPWIIIEEPEAHLYPDSQKSLMELIAFVANKSKARVLITTHSPYILTTAHFQALSGEIEGKEDSPVLDPDFRIDPVDLAAYQLFAKDDSFSCQTIKEANGRINATHIDGVSDEIINGINALLKISIDRGNK